MPSGDAGDRAASIDARECGETVGRECGGTPEAQVVGVMLLKPGVCDVGEPCSDIADGVEGEDEKLALSSTLKSDLGVP
jgi:hypothetical protein